MSDVNAFAAIRRLYDLLEAPPDATPKTIRSCYRKAVKRWHPDLHQGSPEQTRAAAKFRELTEAYRRIQHAPLRYVSKSASRKSSVEEEFPPASTTPLSGRLNAALSSLAATPGAGRRLLWAHFSLVILNVLIPLWALQTVERPRRWGMALPFVVGLVVHALELWDELHGRHASEDHSPIRDFFASFSGVIFLMYPGLMALFLIAASTSVAYLATGPVLAIAAWMFVILHIQTGKS